MAHIIEMDDIFNGKCNNYYKRGCPTLTETRRGNKCRLIISINGQSGPDFNIKKSDDLIEFEKKITNFLNPYKNREYKEGYYWVNCASGEYGHQQTNLYNSIAVLLDKIELANFHIFMIGLINYCDYFNPDRMVWNARIKDGFLNYDDDSFDYDEYVWSIVGIPN